MDPIEAGRLERPGVEVVVGEEWSGEGRRRKRRKRRKREKKKERERTARVMKRSESGFDNITHQFRAFSCGV